MNRRTFIRQSAALAALSSLGISNRVSAEAPPEVRTIRLNHFPAICLAPGYLAEDLLYAEGFEAVKYVERAVNALGPDLIAGRADFWVDAAPSLVNTLDSTDAAVALGGVHAGCYELVAKENVHAVRDLKHRSVSISAIGSVEHIFVSSITAYVGLDPRTEIDWKIGGSSVAAMQTFSDGNADAFLGFAPQPQELRAKGIGHVIVNTTQDRPWSQYFCCMLTGNREFVRKNPIATKRAMRAFLKSADICASDPKLAAQFMTEKGYASNYAMALEILGELPYSRWRDANPEDTIRFHALRLREAGLIKNSPQQLIASGTDWRFFNELRKELKA